MSSNNEIVVTGRLAIALLDLYRELKKANADCGEMEPLFESEIEAIDRAISPDLVDQMESTVVTQHPEDKPSGYLVDLNQGTGKDPDYKWIPYGEPLYGHRYMHVAMYAGEKLAGITERAINARIRSLSNSSPILEGNDRTTSGAIGQP